MVLVGAAEEDDGGDSGRRGQVGGAGVGPDEEVGTFEKGGGFGDGELSRPDVQTVVSVEMMGQLGVVGAAKDDHSPAVFEEAVEQGIPVMDWPPFGRRTGPDVDGEQGLAVGEGVRQEVIGIG
jgi:hypothetical protein